MVKRYLKKVVHVFVLLMILNVMVGYVKYHRLESTPIWQHSLDTKLVSATTSLNEVPPRPLKSKTTYLWCANHYGPNSQLKDFFKCAILAMKHKYTIILPPLYPHLHDKTKGIQRFERFYDLQTLRNAFRFITLEQFIEIGTNNLKQVVIDCYVQHLFPIHTKIHYGNHTLVTVQKYFNISIVFNRQSNLHKYFDARQFSHETEPCSSVFLYIRYETTLNFFSPLSHYAQKIFKFFKRSLLVQRLAQEQLQVLHQLLTGNITTSQSPTLAVAHFRRGDHKVLPIARYAAQLRNLLKNTTSFTHLYIMCPYIEPKEMNLLKSSIPIPFVATDALMKRNATFIEDYLFDIVEQELGYQAPVFIGSPRSTYSSTILWQRVYQDKGKTYLFTTNTDNHPLPLSQRETAFTYDGQLRS